MITLIGTSLAKKGLVFTFTGGAKKCESCRFNSTCLNLEKGRKYEITNVRKVTHKCPVHKDGRVQTIEVKPATIRTAIETKKAYNGSVVIFRSQKCQDQCENFDICHPEGLYDDDTCKIEEVGPKLTCKNGNNLTEVILSH